jgi:hypothetical protein
MQRTPKPEPGADLDLGHDLDLGDRLAALNWFGVKAALGALVCSVHPRPRPSPQHGRNPDRAFVHSL